MHEDPAIQVLQECAHLIAEEAKAQQAEEQAEDNAIIGRLVSANSPSAFRAATGATASTVCNSSMAEVM